MTTVTRYIYEEEACVGGCGTKPTIDLNGNEACVIDNGVECASCDGFVCTACGAKAAESDADYDPTLCPACNGKYATQESYNAALAQQAALSATEAGI